MKLAQEHFNQIYSQVPRLCVDVVIRSGSGVLLGLRDIEPNKGLWALPGGTLFMRESLNDCAVRIAHQETGFVVSPGEILGAIEYLESESSRHTVGLAVDCRVLRGELRPDYQHKQLEWFSTLPQNILPDVGRFLKKHGLH